MSKKMIWGVVTLILLIITATVWKVLHDRAYIQQLENDLAGKQKMSEDRDKPAEQVDQQELDTSHPDYHVHEDGTPHIGTHDEPKAVYTAPEGAVTQPDFSTIDPNDDPVKAAYKRLEYIKNNPYAWGGVHSDRATELIAQLMPPPELIDHNHGDQVLELIDELCTQGDPRGAEALIALICDGDILGPSMTDALEEIGPPAVSYILPYVRENSTMTAIAAEVLGRISVRYRSDLGGIVNHIIIPKLETIAADKENERYESPAPRWAQKALDRLQ